MVGKDHLVEDYLRALGLELAALVRPREVDTLFIGGGTPTHLSPSHLERLLRLVGDWLPLAAGGEFSIEANPAGFDAEKADILHRFGVTRVSLGVQSFSPPLLRTLERDHDESDVARAVEALDRRIDNFSFDLLFGVPGQTLADWRDTLQRAIAFRPAHLSTYGLTYEKGTSFWTRRAQQRLRPVDEAVESEMYELAMDVLPAHGYRQYELSNFALSGRECRHNDVYWQGLPYLGFGPGAASYVAGTRRTNHRSATTWLKRVLEEQSPVGGQEALSPEDRAREAIWLGLRRTDGIDRASFEFRFGIPLDELAGRPLPRLVASGLVEDDGRAIRLTRRGRLLADSVAAEFL